ncbi:ankyrin repeat domain-containing protein [Wolbachia endosymbiont of Folsomia candida]|uniref:ankyrin repeat domain-containing protein n=1 Tax=Wolbachia endosymbiont of Folsomia candida TaxID=169402 RepID=UPI000B5FBA20|nr:ankyrin repeat domain-containing protein [Wolbachia endosymbiont of Folsomia candida]
MTNTNNISINSGTGTTNQNTLSVNEDQRTRSSPISGPSSNNRLGSTFNLRRSSFLNSSFNLAKQQSIDSQADFSISSENYITKEDLVKLYDRVNEISQENFLMPLDEIIQELQSNPKDIPSMLIDRFSNQEWDITSNDGHSFLTIAAERDDKENILYLLGYMEEKLILNYVAKQGKSKPLKIIVDFLKNQGKLEEEINKKDRYGKTALHYAAQFGNKECFELLLKEGARFSDDIYNRSELHFVAQSGNIKFLNYLMDKFKENGVFQFENEIHKKDKYGNNLLHYAAKSGNKECIKRIIGDHIAFTENNNGDTPLHHIASIEAIENKERHSDAITFLIEKMSATLMTDALTVVNKSNKLGYTPLHLAAINSNEVCIGALISKGADINTQNSVDKNTALRYAAMHGHVEAVKKLLALGADKNIEHDDNRTLVHLSAMSGNKDCLEFLIKNFPADMIATDCDGNTPLHLAAQFSDKKCLELLIEEIKSNGIDLSKWIFQKNKNGETAMHSATLSGNVECLEYLIEIIKQKKYGIKENIEDVLIQQDENGEMLLHLAVLSGNVECFDLIVEKIKNTNIEIKESIQSVNKRGRNLLHLAALSGNKECVNSLINLIKDQFEVEDENLVYLINEDIDSNLILHMAAISGNTACIEYLVEKISLVLEVDYISPVDICKKITSENRYGQTPLHLASMCYNDEVIQFLCDSIKKSGILKKEINSKDRLGRTPLHCAVMNDSELGNRGSEYIISEKRQQNQHLKKKVIKSLLYIKKENGEQVVNEEVNFDIKDKGGKTVLDYVLGNPDTNIMQLFLNAFCEKKEKLEQKYHLLEKKDQWRHKWISRINSVLSSIAGVIVTSLILSDMGNSPGKIAASYVAIFCSCVAISLVFLNCYLERKEGKLKSEIQNYNKKINQIENKIEEITGESKKGYMTERERDDLLRQVVKELEILNGIKKLDLSNRSSQERMDESTNTTDTDEQAAKGQSTRRHGIGKLRRQNQVLSPETSMSSQDTRSRTSTFSQANPPTFTFTDHCEQKVTNAREETSAHNGDFRSRTRSDLSHCRRAVGTDKEKTVSSSITGVNVSPLATTPCIL